MTPATWATLRLTHTASEVAEICRRAHYGRAWGRK